MGTERYSLQLPGELSESRILARATFLTAVIRLRPNVIKDLWITALPEFKSAVTARCYSQIANGLDLEKYYQDKEAEFAENPRRCGDYEVALMQQRLSLRNPEGQESLRHEFFSFHKVKTAKDTKSLTIGLRKWASRWNLSEEWCLDQAIAVLRNWLANDELRWVGVFPSRLWAVQFEGWRSAIDDLTNNAHFSIRHRS